MLSLVLNGLKKVPITPTKNLDLYSQSDSVLRHCSTLTVYLTRRIGLLSASFATYNYII